MTTTPVDAAGAVFCRRCHRRAKYGRLCRVHFTATGFHGYVDATPTRHRVALLRSRGWTVRALADRTGVSAKTLMSTSPQVLLSTQRAILAVPVPAAVVVSDADVAAIGSIRRLQALQAIGWTQRAIAAHAGLGFHLINRVPGRDRVKASTAAAITTTYNTLWNQPGPSTRAREHAAEQGWPVPMDYDTDAALDDPTITTVRSDTPENRRCDDATRHFELIEHRRNEVHRLTTLGLSATQIAERVGISDRQVTRLRTAS